MYELLSHARLILILSYACEKLRILLRFNKGLFNDINEPRRLYLYACTFKVNFYCVRVRKNIIVYVGYTTINITYSHSKNLFYSCVQNIYLCAHTQ